MISRNAKILAATGAAVLLTGGAVGATQLDKTVNLSVDGASSTASFFGSRTVGDVLADEGIKVKPGDVVVPAAGSSVDDGDSITVKYARLLNLTVDGKTRQIRTTETTVDAALLAIGLRGDGARLSASRSQTIGRQGLTLTIVTPKAVTVTADGKTTTKTVAAATVGEALTQLGVRLGKVDKVNPPVTTRLTNGAKIAVQRVQTKDTKTTESIAYGTTRTKTNTLYSDQTKVSIAGVNGTRVVTSRATVVDGKVVSRKTIASTVTKAPVNRVLLVGTKARPAAAAPAASTGGSSSGAGLNLARASMWDSIAQCESSGNWHINTGNGYYGGLQFLTSTWLGYGGGDFASRADLASREEQITVANRVYADNGTSQWQCKP
ncbi:transglycosylase [Terrabacter sp. 28]|nr:transglycosylase [Terrabacter sp. 28]